MRTDGPAPYTAPTAVTGLIDAYRERGLQTPFTTDVLIKAGVSETLAPRTLQSIKLLGLVSEDGEPTQQFVDLRKAGEAEFQARLQEILRDAYAEVFSFVDPALDSPARVRDAFRSYTPVGQQERMVTLFLGLCEYAGLTPPNPERQSKALGGAASRKSTPRARASRESRTKDEQGAQPRRYDLAGLGLPGSIAGGHPLIQGLLRELPPVGASWPKPKMQAWLEAQRAVFNLLYKVGDDGQEQLPLHEGGDSG